MAGERPILRKLLSLASSYDDQVLEAMANRGLVRRAHKDLEKESPTILGEDDVALTVAVAGEQVRLPVGVSEATCTCPAGSVCRHILMALLFLKKQSEAVTGPALFPEPPPGENRSGPSLDEMAGVSEEMLVKWAGKALMTRAGRELAGGARAELRAGEAAVFYLPTWNRTVTWIRGGGLEGMVCNCRSASPCVHRVVAVLSLWASRGRHQIEAPAAILEASKGAPRTREEVLASAALLLEDFVCLGFSRLSAATEQRFRTLAISAHGVDLPRLERLLRSLAAEVANSLGREARADSGTLLTLASRAEALRTALGRPSGVLVGQHRTKYDPVGSMELLGLGARLWRTPSGYHGLTVYFWNPSGRNWVTWSDSRPVQAPNFDPRKRFLEEGPWRGCQSPALASRGRVFLTEAFCNRNGRLSGRSATHATVTGPADWSAVGEPITRWSVLRDRAVQLFAGGLGEVPELAHVVLLAPAQWGPPTFDPVRQELLRPIQDADGATVNLSLMHTSENESAIDCLERMPAAIPERILGLLLLREGRLVVEPIAVYQGETAVSLTLAGSVAPQTGGSATGEEPEDDEEEEEEPWSGHAATSLGLLLMAAQGELAKVAEGGIAAPLPLERLKAMKVQLENLGLTTAARLLGTFLDLVGEVRRGALADHRPVASALLRASYVLSLASSQEAVRGAVNATGR